MQRFCYVMLAIVASLSYTGRTQAENIRPQGALPDIRVELQTPAYFYTDNLGANNAGAMRFGIRLMNGVTAQVPTIVTTTLPEGITFIGNSSNSRMNCEAEGQEVTCTYTHALTPSQPAWNVRVQVDVAGDIAIPGASTIRLLRHHATLPAPDPDDCESNLSSGWAVSDTGCVERTVDHRQSLVYFEEDTWSHSPQVWLAGSEENQVSVAFRSQGFTNLHGPLFARFLLPPGFEFNRGGPQSNWACTADAAEPNGQVVHCQWLLGYDMTPSNSSLWLRIDLSPDVPVPGPHTIIGLVSNEYQAPSHDFEQCLMPEPPVGCSVYSLIQIEAPPQAQLEIVDMNHSPDRFQTGAEGQIHIQYTNTGEGPAGPLNLEFAAPPGLIFNRSQNTNPLLSCTASGDAETGQTVTCTGGSGFPVGANGQASLVFDLEWAGYLEALTTIAIGDTTRPGPELDSCQDNADQVGCGEHLIRVSDALFCDRFEHPSAGCRPL